MAGLHADQARERAEEVVPREERPPAPDPRSAPPDELANEGQPHRRAGEDQDVARRRDVARRIETVWAHEVRLAQAELARLRVHQADEARDVPVPDGGGKRVGGVVRALDQGGRQEIAHGEALSRTKVDARFADRRRERPDPHRVAWPRVLEDDDRGHELRDARRRNARVRIPRGDHLSGRRVRDQIGAGIGPRRAFCRRGRSGGENRAGEKEQ
jgi:hypothetical protein